MSWLGSTVSFCSSQAFTGQGQADMLKLIWAPAAIAALLIAGFAYKWPVEMLGPGLGVLFIAGVFSTVSYFTQRNSKRSALQLKEMATYFARRFAGGSSLSVFSIIEGLNGPSAPAIREWLRGCDMSQLIFDDWCQGFAARIEHDANGGKLTRLYLRELWSMIIHYQEFVEQFYEVAEKAGISQDTVGRYNRFVAEYNPFIQRFQDYVGKLRRANRTEVEPPSMKLARELRLEQASPPAPKETKVFGEPPDHKGYILGRRPDKGDG